MQQCLFDIEAAEIERATKRSRHHWADDDSGEERREDLFGVEESRIEVFGSGCSARWDMAGWMLARKPVGVAASELRLDDRIGKLRAYAESGGRVFVDSGAFGAFRAGSTLDFGRVATPIYDALVAGCGAPEGFVLVMPDVIGDARATARLQGEMRGDIERWLESGAECLFPLQLGGDGPLREYERLQALCAGRAFVLGVPSNEAAWTEAQLVRFAAQARPARMHLLGLSNARRLARIEGALRVASPQSVVSCDACRIVANVGIGRRITDRCSSRIDDAVSWIEAGGWIEEPGLDIEDLSTYLADLWNEPGFLDRRQAKELAEALGLAGAEWSRRFEEAAAEGMRAVLGELDPDEEWIHDAVAEIAKARWYGPMVRERITGPVRAWEVARIANGRSVDDPHEAGRPMNACRSVPGCSAQRG